MVTVQAAWVLTLMQSIEPNAPWKDTYEKTAEVFAKVANEQPLFKGEDGAMRTAALFVSVAWFEGRLKPNAIGDKGQSVCAFQVGVSNLAALGTTKDAMLDDIEVCTKSARTMMATSFRVCANKPVEDIMAHYAFGGPTCGGPKEEGFRESRHRMRKAEWLFAKMRRLRVNPG